MELDFDEELDPKDYRVFNNFSRYKYYSAASANEGRLLKNVRLRNTRDRYRELERASRLLYLIKSKSEQILFDLNCQNYLKLFNHKRRSKLEQSLLVYTCHVKYLASRFEFNIGDLINNPFADSRNVLTTLFKLTCRTFGVKGNPKKEEVAKLIPVVEEQLVEFGLGRLPIEFYSFNYKGVKN